MDTAKATLTFIAMVSAGLLAGSIVPVATYLQDQQRWNVTCENSPVQTGVTTLSMFAGVTRFTTADGRAHYTTKPCEATRT